VATPAAPGRVLDGRYRLDSLLARGGMASVWVSDDILLARRVAVKTLHPELAVDDSLRMRFRNEAIAVASLAHPDIVATYDTGEDDGVAYLVMELVEGPNLRVLLDQRRSLGVAETVRIARGVSAALDHAHRNRIVHRDIKPANVLVPDHGPVKVTDFGIAKAEGAGDLTRSGTVVGTARYLSPEQVQAAPVDARSDIYAVGLLLFEMLAGRPPFEGGTDMEAAVARLTTAPPRLSTLRPDVPPALESITMRCLAVEPSGRFPDARSLVAALDELIDDDSDAGRPRSATATIAPARTTTREAPPAHQAPPVRTAPSRRPRSPKRRQSSGLLFAIVGVVLIAGGAAAGFLIVQETQDGGSGSGSVTGVVPQVVGASDFDPEGDDTEHPESTAAAIDGDASTSWTTERYDSASFGGIKSGVGLQLDLAGAADVSSISIDTEEGGWGAQIYVADEPAESLEAWGPPRASVDDASAQAQIDVSPTAAGAHVLIWFTGLPASGRITVAEVRVA
jgi:serine/threonine-protein kinase